MDERELGAPEDSSRVRQGFDEVDVRGERLRPFRRRAKGMFGPVVKSAGRAIQCGGHPTAEPSVRACCVGSHVHERAGYWLAGRQAGDAKQAEVGRDKSNSPVLPVQILGVEVEDGQSSVGELLKVRVWHEWLCCAGISTIVVEP